MPLVLLVPQEQAVLRDRQVPQEQMVPLERQEQTVPLERQVQLEQMALEVMTAIEARARTKTERAASGIHAS